MMFDVTGYLDNTVPNYIKSKLVDTWKNTPFEGYTFLSPRQKGMMGENFVEKIMITNGHNVSPKQNEGHDRIINKIKTEIKFSLCSNGKNGPKEDYFFINHVSTGKDWDRLIFCGVNYNLKNTRLFWFTKEDFEKHLKPIFAKQQGGSSLSNDDYKLSGNISDLLNSKHIKSIDDWDL